LPVIQAMISQVNCLFLQKFTQTYSKKFTYETKPKFFMKLFIKKIDIVISVN
jgi:hypothetical protein